MIAAIGSTRSIVTTQSALAIWIVLSCTAGAATTLTLASTERNREPSTTRPNSPCFGQSKSLTELKAEFERAKLPSRPEITASWVAIGIFGAAESHGTEQVSLDCNGITQEVTGKCELAMLVEGYSLEPHFVGSGTGRRPITPDADDTGSLSFWVDFGGDAIPYFRCRMTTRGTVACLVDEYREGYEFKKMRVTRDKLYQQN
jgi:hypothetical protein